MAFYLSGVPVMTHATPSAYDCEKGIETAVEEVALVLAPFTRGVATNDGSIHRVSEFTVACVEATDHLTSLLQETPA